jgi:hypothetical protein
MRAERLAKLHALADPARNPNEHERAMAQAEIERLQRRPSAARTVTVARTATIWIEGGWTYATVPLALYEEAREIAIDAIGTVGRIGNDLAWYEDDEIVRDTLVDALRGCGYVVTIEQRRDGLALAPGAA